jgi:hypothetical protein
MTRAVDQRARVSSRCSNQMEELVMANELTWKDITFYYSHDGKILIDDRQMGNSDAQFRVISAAHFAVAPRTPPAPPWHTAYSRAVDWLSAPPPSTFLSAPVPAPAPTPAPMAVAAPSMPMPTLISIPARHVRTQEWGGLRQARCRPPGVGVAGLE